MQEQAIHKVIASRAQIVTIEKVVSQISIGTLREDLLDHLCCAVEDRMETGITFEEALQDAVDDLAPDGLQVIQKETIELLNSTTLNMKRLTYTVGLLSTMSFATGYMFFILHINGANALQVGGLVTFAFAFLPLISYDYLKKSDRARYDRLKFIFGLCSGMMVGTAAVMKVYHLAGANEMLVLGFGLFVFAFLPFLFFSLYKQSTSQG